MSVHVFPIYISRLRCSMSIYLITIKVCNISVLSATATDLVANPRKEGSDWTLLEFGKDTVRVTLVLKNNEGLPLVKVFLCCNIHVRLQFFDDVILFINLFVKFFNSLVLNS